jgi:hypothetical protein
LHNQPLNPCEPSFIFELEIETKQWAEATEKGMGRESAAPARMIRSALTSVRERTTRGWRQSVNSQVPSPGGKIIRPAAFYLFWTTHRTAAIPHKLPHTVSLAMDHALHRAHNPCKIERHKIGTCHRRIVHRPPATTDGVCFLFCMTHLLRGRRSVGRSANVLAVGKSICRALVPAVATVRSTMARQDGLASALTCSGQ